MLTLMITCLLVSTYVVCERLSVMQRQAGLPGFFDQNWQQHPILKCGTEHPPPPHKFPNSTFLPQVQMRPLAEQPPPQISKLHFSSQSPNLTFGRTPPKISKLYFSSPSPNLTFGRIPPPKFPNSTFLPQVQIQPLAESPPPNLQTRLFFGESKSDL